MDSAKVIRLARDVGLQISDNSSIAVFTKIELERFAALIQQSLIDEGWRSPEQVKEYGESVRKQAVEKAEIERDGYDLTGQSTDVNGPNAYIVGYQVGCTDCAAAIEQMKIK